MKRPESLRIRAEISRNRKIKNLEKLSDSVQKLCETLDLLAEVLNRKEERECKEYNKVTQTKIAQKDNSNNSQVDFVLH